jgi:hypothetical protein
MTVVPLNLKYFLLSFLFSITAVYDIYNIDVICCNRQLYNNSYLCCKPQSSVEIPTLKQNRNDNTCCGKTTFHPLVAMCCDGKVEFGSKVEALPFLIFPCWKTFNRNRSIV